MITEAKLKEQVTAYLKTIPNLWFFHPAHRWIVGLPDFIICYKRQFIAIELKKEGKFLRKIQRYIMKKIRDAGGTTMTAYNLEDVEKIIKEEGNENI